MPQERPNFDPASGDDTSGALRKLDLNCVDLDTRLTAAQADINDIEETADAALPKTGGAVSGNLQVAGTGRFGAKLTAESGTVQVGADSGDYAQMDYRGRVTRNVNTNPTTNSATIAHSVSGNFGGGYMINDGTTAIGLWSTSGTLNFGFGNFNGPLTARCTLSPSGNLSISGTLSQSDYRLKQEIEEIDPAQAYAAVLGVRPIRYIRLDFPEDQRRLTEGVIAHELAVVMPNLVVGEKDQMGSIDVYDDDGSVIGETPMPVYQTVDYNGIGIELVAAFKHLDGLVKAQAAVIEAMGERIASLEAR